MKFVYEGDDKRVVITGWRAWVIALPILLVISIVLVMLALLVIGIALTIGTVLVFGVPIAIGLALIFHLLRSSKQKRNRPADLSSRTDRIADGSRGRPE